MYFEYLAVIALEKIYTTIDWPLLEPSLEISLKQSGKSRADLWQFAGKLVRSRQHFKKQ